PQPATSEITNTGLPTSTESRENDMTESTIRDTSRLRDIEMARPVRNTTWKRNTDETLPLYRM
ncbi:hypothetical protein BG015_001355, partial [Linnemannia schmuckeri]